MKIIDTHAHLFVEEFQRDIDDVIERAKASNVGKILLPNIDVQSVSDLIKLWKSDSSFFSPMMGIHPCSIGKSYLSDLDFIFSLFDKHEFVAVGEIGLDYYWSKEYINEQKDAFRKQIRFAKSKNLPVAVHCRDAYRDIIDILREEQGGMLNGVLHCFSGTAEDAERLTDINFKLGIGGVVTFKNSGLDKILANIDIGNIVLETDSPYLAPVPYRGKRNESAYLPYIVKKLSEIYSLNEQEVIRITTDTAMRLFDIEL